VIASRIFLLEAGFVFFTAIGGCKFNPKYALGIVMKWRNPIMKGALARFLFEGVWAYIKNKNRESAFH
ncbi:MAG: hypothetical protein ACKOW8_12200, partial [Flavobacteriales bacterium]